MPFYVNSSYYPHQLHCQAVLSNVDVLLLGLAQNEDTKENNRSLAGTLGLRLENSTTVCLHFQCWLSIFNAVLLSVKCVGYPKNHVTNTIVLSITNMLENRH